MRNYTKRGDAFYQRMQAVIDEEAIPISEVAQRFGIPVATANRKLTAHPKFVKPHPPERVEACRQLVEQGEAVARAARLVGMSTTAARRAGIKRPAWNRTWSRRKVF